MRLLRLLLIPIITLAMPGQAATPPPQFLLETIYIKPIKNQEAEIKHEHVSKIIPSNLQPGQESEESVGIKVMDQSLTSFTQGDLFKGSDLGRATKTVENSLKTELVLGSGKPGAIEHHLNMQVLAFQGMANLEYRGLLQVDMTLGGAGFEMILNEKLNETTDFKLKHATQTNASTAYVVWAW